MKSNEKRLNVPYFAFEAVQARSERMTRRLIVLCAISAVAVVIEGILIHTER